MTTPEKDSARVPIEAEADCTVVLDRVHEFLDQELDDASCDEIRAHLDACEQCLDNFDAEAAVRQLVQRCCRGDAAPQGLRASIMMKLRQG